MKSILMGKTQKGLIYIDQIKTNVFTVRTGKRHLTTTTSITEAESWLAKNDFKIKAKK